MQYFSRTLTLPICVLLLFTQQTMGFKITVKNYTDHHLSVHLRTSLYFPMTQAGMLQPPESVVSGTTTQDYEQVDLAIESKGNKIAYLKNEVDILTIFWQDQLTGKKYKVDVTAQPTKDSIFGIYDNGKWGSDWMGEGTAKEWRGSW